MYLALESMMKISSVVSSINTASSDDVVDVVRASFVAPEVGTLSVCNDCKISESVWLVDSSTVELDVKSVRDRSSLISCSVISAISLDVVTVLVTAFFGTEMGAT